MSYTTDDILYLGSEPYDLGRILRVWTAHTDRIIQLYLAGRLIAWQRPDGGAVTFHVPDAGAADPVFLLAVDAADAATDFWSQAFSEPAAHGNRIRVRLPRYLSYRSDTVVGVYLGDAGDATAGTLVRRMQLFTGARRSGGRGMDARGYGGRGWYAGNAAGRGRGARGYGQRGMDASLLDWSSQPLRPGLYPVRIVLTDGCGNESTAHESTVRIDTYAQPASGLTIESYDSAADALELSWTPSPDI